MVKWKGYTRKHDSWINETDLNAAKLIEEYEQWNQNEEITPNNNNNNNKTQTITQNGTEYLVKWKGYTWKHDSWINETDLNAAKLIEEYEQRSQNEEITPNNNNNDNKTQTITMKRKRKILWNNLGEGGVVTGAKWANKAKE